MKYKSDSLLDVKTWWTKFRRNLGFWSLQCLISALPGFCMAMWYLNLSENPLAPLAMLAALVTFVLVVTSLTSFNGTLTAWRTLPSRGMRLGLQLRGISSVASLLVIAAIMATDGDYENPVTLLMPDFWTGVSALISIALLSEPFGFENPVAQLLDGETDLGFLVIYSIAIIDGLILCFLIFIVSFVSMLILQMRDRTGTHLNRAGLVPAILAKLRSMGQGNAIHVLKKPLNKSP